MANPNGRMCLVEGCESDYSCRGYCNKHYLRWRKHGDPHVLGRAGAPRTDRVCEESGCEGAASALGLCKKHYSSLRRKTDPNYQEYMAAYRANNRDRVNEHSRRWAASNRETYRQAYLRYRSRKLAATIMPVTEVALSQRVAYYGGKCWICREMPYEELDHVKPLSKGGPHMLSNLRPACRACNRRKSAKWSLVGSPA